MDATLHDVKQSIEEIGAHNKGKYEELESRLRRFEAKENRARLALGGDSAGADANGLPDGERKAFEKFVRSGEFDRKAMTIGTSPDGGYLVPHQLAKEILKVAAIYSPMLEIANVFDGVSGSFAVNVASGLPATGWVNETGTRSATATPTISQVHPMNGGCYANASISSWLAEDAAYDVGAFVVEEIGRAAGVAMGTAFANGDGVNKPFGLTSANWVTTADATRAFADGQYVASGTSGGGITIDKCLDCLFALKPEYRAPGRASWLMATSALNTLRQIKASTGGSYLWFEPNGPAGRPTLAGLPVYEDSNLTVGASSLSVFVGDFKRAYAVTLIGQPVPIRDPYTSKGNLLFYFERRVGGSPLDLSAVKALKLSTS